MEKNENRNARRSRALIREAYVSLLNEKEPSKITVADIIRRADISRTTFYAHYEDSRAVIEELEREILNAIVEIMNEEGYGDFCKNPLPLLKKVSAFYARDLGLYKALIHVDEFVRFKQDMSDLYVARMMADEGIPEAVRKTPEFIAMAQYMAYGIEGAYIAWFKDKIPITLEEMTEMLARAIQVGTRKLEDLLK